MPIIPRVGRQTPFLRTVIIMAYVILSLGAVTMLYPFLLMLAHSVSSEVDMNDYRIIPRYFYNDGALYQKYIENKYLPRFISSYNEQHGTNYILYQDILPPEPDPLVADWYDFKQSLSLKFKQAAFITDGFRTVIGITQRDFQKYAWSRYRSLEAINQAYQQKHQYLRSLRIPREELLKRDWYPAPDQHQADWLALKATLPEWQLTAVSGRGTWITFVRNHFNNSLEKLNAAFQTAYQSFEELRLPVRLPANPALWPVWEKFVRERWPFRYMTVDEKALPFYQALLEKKYGTLARFNRAHQTGFTSFREISYPADFNAPGPHLVDWAEYIKNVPLECIQLVTVEDLFRKHLRARYHSLAELNRALGTAYSSFLQIIPPYAAADFGDLVAARQKLRVYFMVRNYYEVIDYIALHGRALAVTLIYIAAVILTQLTVNPFCAYALSRFNLSYAYKVILFLLVTMAFPFEVTMIPNFILLKQLNLLNTFWALILPGMANGYFIFILKGFFDSLPADLYEAANLDGANELVIYFRITMPLARPVLAWMTLHAFTSAYSAFMFAMVICQDSRMWTLMVWIYEMQRWASPFLITAAITLSAIPSLVVFTVCQNIIMRGMILPVAQ